MRCADSTEAATWLQCLGSLAPMLRRLPHKRAVAAADTAAGWEVLWQEVCLPGVRNADALVR